MQTVEWSAANAAAWDALVAADPRGHLLQTWAWGDLKASFGWEAVRIAVTQDGAPLAGAQVLFRRTGPLAYAYLPKGPALPDASPEVAAALWEGVHAAARKRRTVTLKVEPEWPDGDASAHAWLLQHGLRPSAETVQPRRTISVDLEATEEEILARMKSKWRYNVRLAERKGVTIRQVGPEGVPTFHALMLATGERDEFGVRSADYYRRVLELFAPEGRAALFLAYLGDEPLAGVLAAAFNRQAWYLYGASSNAHREAMPNHLLQWHAMRWARDRGAYKYDLCGIPDVDPNSPTQELEGVGRFKAGFGGDVVRYVGAYDYVYSPLLARVTERAIRLWRARRRSAGPARATPQAL